MADPKLTFFFLPNTLDDYKYHWNRGGGIRVRGWGGDGANANDLLSNNTNVHRS